MYSLVSVSLKLNYVQKNYPDLKKKKREHLLWQKVGFVLLLFHGRTIFQQKKVWWDQNFLELHEYGSFEIIQKKMYNCIRLFFNMVYE